MSHMPLGMKEIRGNPVSATLSQKKEKTHAFHIHTHAILTFGYILKPRNTINENQPLLK